MDRIGSYPEVYAIGHAAIKDIFEDPVRVQEKVDGSQFSMALSEGVLHCRSKGQEVNIDAPDKMFSKAVELAKDLPLHEGWVYRGEWLQKPKHNTLAYDRTPKWGFVIFDIQTGLEEYMLNTDAEVARLGLESVPEFYVGKVESLEQLKGFLDRDSFLGGTKIEGVVVKNYDRFTKDKKAMLGKLVSERFKEIHGASWKERNPNSHDILTNLTTMYRTEARWEKAVQHLRDAGTLEGSPKDIGGLFKEVPQDIRKECEEEIKEALFARFWPLLSRSCTAGMAEWYKLKLAATAFEEE